MIKNQYLFWLILSLFSMGSCDSYSTKSQVSENVNTITRGDIKKPADMAKIMLGFDRVKISEINEEELKNQPVPQVFFIFQCSESRVNCKDGKHSQELPEDAKKIISKYWIGSVSYAYQMNSKPIKVKDSDTYTNLITKKALDGKRFEEEMQKIEIDAPLGKRKISNAEAVEITKLIDESMCKTVQQSDRCEPQ